MAALHQLRERWNRHRSTGTGEAGFTIVETTVAMALVFVVLTGTLATFSASVRNLVSGRQRTGAVALARAVIEDARAAPYAQVGHNLSSDATLDDDPAVTGSPRTYEGEQLVGVPQPTALLDPHRRTVTNDSGTYTQLVYVTWVTQGTADPFKRLTVVVEWERAPHDPAVISNQVRISSFLFEAGVPPDPMVEGLADADGGTVEVTGTLAGIDLSRAVIYNPSTSGALGSLFIREGSGQARSASGILELNSGSVSGCDVSGSSADCNGTAADSATDSDTSTGLPEHDAEGPSYDGAQSATAGDVLTLSLGSGDSVQSKSTSRSCFSCYATAIGDDDRLAYHWSEATGPGTASFAFDVGTVTGDLMDAGGAATATSTLDQDAASDTHIVSSSARLQVPGVDLVTVDGAPADFLGAVQIGAVDVQVDAGAGPTMASPSVTGAPVDLQLYDTVGGSLEYRTVTVTPGDQVEDTAVGSFVVNGATVSLTTTVVSGGKATASTTDAGGTITYAEASLTNWLRVTVNLVITSGADTLADTTVEFDYGRLATRAQWESV